MRTILWIVCLVVALELAPKAVFARTKSRTPSSTADHRTLSSSATSTFSFSGTKSSEGSVTKSRTVSSTTTPTISLTTTDSAESSSTRSLTRTASHSKTISLTSTHSYEGPSSSRTLSSVRTRSRTSTTSLTDSRSGTVTVTGDSSSSRSITSNRTRSKTATAPRSLTTSPSKYRSVTATLSRTTMTGTKTLTQERSKSLSPSSEWTVSSTSSGSKSASQEASVTISRRSATHSPSSEATLTGSRNHTHSRTFSQAKSTSASPSFDSSNTRSNTNVPATRTKSKQDSKTVSYTGQRTGSRTKSKRSSSSTWTLTPPPTPSPSKTRNTASMTKTLILSPTSSTSLTNEHPSMSFTASVTTTRSPEHSHTVTNTPDASLTRSQTVSVTISATRSGNTVTKTRTRTPRVTPSRTESPRNLTTSFTFTTARSETLSQSYDLSLSMSYTQQLTSTRSPTKIPTPSTTFAVSMTKSQTKGTKTRSRPGTRTRSSEVTVTRSLSDTSEVSPTRSSNSTNSATSTANTTFTLTSNSTRTITLTKNMSFTQTHNATDTQTSTLLLTPSKTRPVTPTGTRTANLTSATVTTTRTIDPCNKTHVSSNEGFFHGIEVFPRIGEQVNASEFLVVSRTDFQNAGSISVTIRLAVALRNFGGNTSLRWFPPPEVSGCDILGITLPDIHTIVIETRFQPNDQLTLQDDSVCNFTISTDAFQCQLLTNEAFNFTLSIHVIAPDPLIPDNILKLAALLGTISASVLGAAVGGGLVLQQSRAQTVLNLANCQFSLVSKMQFADSPTGLGIGSATGRYFRGAVVGNVSILVGVALGGCIICLIGGLYHVKRRGDTLFGGFSRMARTIHFPGFMVFPLSFTFDNTIGSSVSLLFHKTDAYDHAIGIFGICFMIIAVLIPLVYVTIVAFKCILVKTELPAEHYFYYVPSGMSVKGLLKSLLVPTVRWEATAQSPYFKRMFLMIFNEYNVPYFLVIELVASAIVGAAGGVNISERSVCNALALTCFIVLGLFVIALVTIRPNSQLFGLLFSILLNLLTFVSCMFLFMSTQLRDRKWAYYSAVISLCVAFVVVLKLLLDFFGAFLWLREKVKALTKKPGAELTDEVDLTSRKKALEDLISGVDGGEVASLHGDGFEDFLRVVVGDEEAGAEEGEEMAELHVPDPDLDDLLLEEEIDDDELDAILAAGMNDGEDVPAALDDEDNIIQDDPNEMSEDAAVRQRRIASLRRSLSTAGKRKLSRMAMRLGRSHTLLGTEDFDDPLLGAAMRLEARPKVETSPGASNDAMTLLDQLMKPAAAGGSTAEVSAAEVPAAGEQAQTVDHVAEDVLEASPESEPAGTAAEEMGAEPPVLPLAQEPEDRQLEALLEAAADDVIHPLEQASDEQGLTIASTIERNPQQDATRNVLDSLLRAIDDMPPEPPPPMQIVVQPCVPDEIDPDTI